jgi:hypothetical protein
MARSGDRGESLEDAARAVRRVLRGAADAYEDAAAAHDEVASARDETAKLLEEREQPESAADRRQKARRASNDATVDRIKADEHRDLADQAIAPDD